MRYIFSASEQSESEDGIETINYFDDANDPVYEVRVYTTNGLYGDCIRVNTVTSSWQDFTPTRYMLKECDEQYYQSHIEVRAR